MMTIDVVYFGYGAGVVLLGWVCGGGVRALLSAIGMARGI